MSSYKAEDLDAIQILYCTPSLGMHPSHTLQRKLEAISKAGFTGIELGFDDLVSFAKNVDLSHIPSMSILKEIEVDDLDDQPEHQQDKYYGVLKFVCELVHKHCAVLKLEIFCLQPFAMFEGYEGEKRERNLFKAKKWLELAHVLGCKALQVGSCPDPSTNPDTAIKDLQELADIAATYQPKIRIAYENWCWAAHYPTWSAIHSVAQKVNRPNFGLCVDTFQSAGLEIGDPSTESGFIDNKPLSAVIDQWKKSCSDLGKTVPKEEIYYLQISDAVRPEPRITEKTEGYDEINKTRGLWSHAYRPLPYSDDGYLPWMDFIKGVLDTGFRGPMSMEVFEKKMEEKDWDLESYAKRAMEVWERIKKDLVEAK